MKDKKWIKKADLFLILLLLAVSIPLILYKPAANNPVAVISKNGKEIQRIDLSKVDKPYEIDLNCSPDAVLSVKPGAIRYSHAECHDKLCVNSGWLREPGDTAACLPSKTIVCIEGGETSSDKPDAITW